MYQSDENLCIEWGNLLKKGFLLEAGWFSKGYKIHEFIMYFKYNMYMYVSAAVQFVCKYINSTPPPFPPLHMHGITMSFNYIQKTKQNGYLVIKRTHYVSRGFSCCRCVITHLVCLQCSHLTPHSGSFLVNYARSGIWR